MRKKTKVISAVLALCLSVSMLAVGVLAASTVTLNVTSSVTFKSTGAYVMTTGQVKRGTEGSLTNLTEEDRPETDTTSGASYSYTGYSYTPIGSGSDANAPDGTAPKDLEDWTIGEIEFLDTAPVIQYSISFKNYGESEVEINITGMPDEITNVEIKGTTLPITVASGETEEYTLTLTLTKFNESIDPAVQVNLNTTMVSKNIAVTPEPNTFTCTYEKSGGTGEGGYIYIYVNDTCVLYSSFSTGEIADGTVGSFEIKEGDIIDVFNSEQNLNLLNSNVSYAPPLGGWGGYDCRLYNEEGELVASASLFGSGTGQGEKTGFPYTVTGNLRMEIIGTDGNF